MDRSLKMRVVFCLVAAFAVSSGLNVASAAPVKQASAVSAFTETLAKAQQGDAEAQIKIGVMYDYGRGVAQDFAAAVSWYRKAANQNNAEAQTGLGHMYTNGRGVEKDYAAANSWYRLAADQGHARAQYALGNMHYLGRDVEKDYAAANSWYRLAADQGHAKAQHRLGQMYALGYGVTKDYTAADFWLRKAANQGISEAVDDLAQIPILLERDINSSIRQAESQQRQNEITRQLFNDLEQIRRDQGAAEERHASERVASEIAEKRDSDFKRELNNLRNCIRDRSWC